MNAKHSVLFAILLSLLPAVAFAAPQPKPAILFCSPQGPAYGWVDLDYLALLHRRGFEVDFTDTLAEITAERIARYNALVIFITPDAYDVTMTGQKTSPAKVRAFAEMIDRYVTAGGGVLLMPTETNMLKQSVIDLTDRMGAKIPVERIEETDKTKLGHLTHSSQATPLAWTDRVPQSPVSEGVRQVWYPYADAYNAQLTGPLVVDSNWQVVLRASATAKTKPVDLAKSTMPVLENPFVRQGVEQSPAIAAIRTYRGGRVALVHQWRQFSIGSGTRYIFDHQVLAKGFGDRPSDFGRLLENTCRWLADPSLALGKPGGYVTGPRRLLPPNQDPKVKQDYAERRWPYDKSKLGEAGPQPHLKLFRGMIGAKSTYSVGASTVAEYAKAAADAGLDFVVFLDDFASLTPQKLQSLAADCSRASTGKLKLLPGFSIQNNIGNRMFFFSPQPAWIPDYCLTGPGKKTLYIQEEDGKGNYTGYLTPFLDWVLNNYHVEKGQVGYYDFAAAPHGMRMWDLRLYGMAAVRYYRDGRLVEDKTEDYLTTAQATIPPAPVSVDEVTSAEALVRGVRAGRPLVYAQAASLDRVFADALRWTHQYDAPNVFHSDGPIVRAWPECHRVWTLGAEEFVTGSAVMPAPLSVVAPRGLKEIRLYDGRRLFRRFLPGGAKEFHQTLVLDGTVQKNIVLVAEDIAGGRAITFARRCWKDGSLAVSFCSDHVNDGTMALAHGPYNYQVIRHPSLPTDVAGDTWDGGPLASLPLTGNQATAPIVESDHGREDGNRFDQVPLLEFTDEGAMAVASRRRELFDPRVLAVVNPWHTYGPIAGPAPLMHYTQKYCEWLPPTVAVPQTGWAGPGVRQGTNASLFRNQIEFQRDLTVKSLNWGYFTGAPNAKVVISRDGKLEEIDLATPGQYQSYTLRRGDWFGFYSPKLANSNVLFNRGEPIRIENRAPYVFFFAPGDKTPARRGQLATFELAAIGIPLNVEVKTRAELMRYVDYLKSPTGLSVLRGGLVESPGLLELKIDGQGAAEVSIPRPAAKLALTVPCRVGGLNTRWTAGLFQRQGYVKGDYGRGEDRYRTLGIDDEGNAYMPLYVELAERTHVVAGHPVIAGPEGAELFIQVMKVSANPDRWHVSLNNPTDRTITTSLRTGMTLPGLDLPEQSVTLRPGEYRVLR